MDLFRSHRIVLSMASSVELKTLSQIMRRFVKPADETVPKTGMTPQVTAWTEAFNRLISNWGSKSDPQYNDWIVYNALIGLKSARTNGQVHGRELKAITRTLLEYSSLNAYLLKEFDDFASVSTYVKDELIDGNNKWLQTDKQIELMNKLRYLIKHPRKRDQKARSAQRKV